MRKSIVLFVAVGVVVFCVLCARDPQWVYDVLTPDWSDRFYAPIDDGDTITAFSISGTNNKKEIRFAFDNQRDLDELYKAMRDDNVPFGTLNAKCLLFDLDYSCTFSDGATLEYGATLHVFKERTYLRIFYPEDFGFHGDPSIEFQLEEAVGKKVLVKLRKTFLNGDEPPPS